MNEPVDVKRQGILFSVVGPAAGGKTTLCRRLLDHFGSTLNYSVSVTSRPKRPGEIEGKSYHFVSRAEFERHIKQGDLFEWEEVHGNLYGTLRNVLMDAVSTGQDLLLAIEVRGALAVKQKLPQNAVNIFVVPPSYAELKARLLGRGAIAEEDFKRRIQTARQEYQTLLEQMAGPNGFDYFVLNDDLERAVELLKAIVTAERARLSRLSAADVKSICQVEEP